MIKVAKPIQPMLAKLTLDAFDNPQWSWEIKFDGIRCIARLTQSAYELQSRSGRLMTENFPELIFKTKAESIVIDGELVSYNRLGDVSQFQNIQKRTTRVAELEQAVRDYPGTYEVFDVLEVNGRDVKSWPLAKRRQILTEAIIETENVKIAQVFPSGRALFQEAQAKGYEGVIGKLNASLYVEHERRNWIKVKCGINDDFLVCGFTQGTGRRAPTFGALLLGQVVEGQLVFVGEVGTGFNDAELARLVQVFATEKKIKNPFAVGKFDNDATFVTPNLVAHIHFAEWTDAGQLRHPAYKGMD